MSTTIAIKLKIKQHHDTITHFIYFQVPMSNSKMNFTVNLPIKNCSGKTRGTATFDKFCHNGWLWYNWSTALLDVFTTGPKYSEPKSINCKHNFKIIMDSVEDFARQWTQVKRNTCTCVLFLIGLRVWGRKYK